MDRKAFHSIPCGMQLVSTRMEDGRAVGCVINTFQQIASEPPMICVALNKDCTTCGAIRSAGRFDVAQLSEKATMDLIGTFGFKNSLEVDKFSEFPCGEDSFGIPYVKEGTCARFEVEVADTIDVGSHLLFTGVVKDCTVTNDDEPLTYEYYHRVLKGRTPPKAATYHGDGASASASPSTSEGDAPKYAWKCTICGHIEYVDELPEDFRCPVCGVGRELFQRIEL